MKSVSGKVEFALPDSATFQSLAAGQKLPLGSTIRTGADGVAIVVVVPGAAIRVGAGSQLVLEQMEAAKEANVVTGRKARMALRSGTVSALIQANDPSNTDFVIKTPEGAMAARGTFYAVTVEDGKSYVSVKEGKIAVESLKKAVASR